MIVAITRKVHRGRVGSLAMLQRGVALLFPVFVLLLSLIPARAFAEGNALEQFNKAMSDFNQKYYANSGSEAAHFFSDTVPEDVRRGLSNFFANLAEPVVAVSSLAQGDMDNAGIATHRFFYNLVFGYGGVYDRASEVGVKSAPRDMGQAACANGIPDGPYLVLPFYGPSSVGDFFGSTLPVLAGYVALGEAFWVYRASSKVASTMSPDAPPPAKGEAGKDQASAAEAARLEQIYRLEKEHYLAARERACAKHPAPPPASTPHQHPASAADNGGAQLASVPR